MEAPEDPAEEAVAAAAAAPEAWERPSGSSAEAAVPTGRSGFDGSPGKGGSITVTYDPQAQTLHGGDPPVEQRRAGARIPRRARRAAVVNICPQTNEC